MKTPSMWKFLFCSLWFVCFSVGFVQAEVRMITVVNYENEGVKQWLPGTIVVKKGDEVKLKLINKVPSGLHGFSIEEFKVKESVKKGETKEVGFSADKAGIFPINCHLHPAHVGGQLVVLE